MKVVAKVSSAILATVFAVSMYAGPASAAFTSDQALANYQKNYQSYTQDELVKVDQYRQNYLGIKGSLADKLVERAIWYMDNGYAVYGSGRKAYQETGIVDCSNFVSLVYSDFKFDITTAAKEYGSVGTRINGVSAAKVGNYWTLQGTENLRPGDVLTWWKTDASGKQYINHVAIFMGMLNGQPAVIGTRSTDNPTALGIVNDFRFWWGSNFFTAQRILPDDAWTPGKTITGHETLLPVVPKNPILKPQKPVTMPEGVSRTGTSTQPTPTQPTPTQPTPTQPTPTQPTPTQPDQTTTPTQPGTYVTPQKGWVSYRVGPSLSSTVLGRLELGSYAKVSKKYNSAYYAIEINGQTGYITTSPTYIKTLVIPEPTTSTTPAQQTYVTPQKGWVSYRAAASSSSATLGRLELGDYALLVKKANSYWYQIQVNGKTAYITTNTTYIKTVVK